MMKHELRKILGLDIVQIRPLSGGSINKTILVETAEGLFVVKINEANRYPNMFNAEARGLEVLSKANCIRVPKVLQVNETSHSAVLVLEYLNPAVRQPNFWENFGHSLALLHQNTQPKFGIDFDNYIGSLPQSNHLHETWEDFYINERLLPQLKIGLTLGLLESKQEKQLNALCKKINEICPKEPPALTHGDLWNGNFVTDESGQAAIIDPSVAFTHREMDLAMSRLFGGFEARFYESYIETFPLNPQFNQRLEVYQLYYLLVHVNLFGRSYLGSVERILERFA